MGPSSSLEAYPHAIRRAFRVWPLFLIKGLFFTLQTFSFFLCWTFLFGPFVARHFEVFQKGLQDPESYDWSAPMADLDRMFKDPVWIGIFLGTLFLYLTWWSLVSALEDGGVYGTFLDLEREGKSFSIPRAIHWALRTFVPMLLLQVYLGFWLLIPFALAALVPLLALSFLAVANPGLSFALFLGLFLGLPMLVGGVLFGISFWAFGFLARAYVVRGFSAGAAMREAFVRFRSQGWRSGFLLMAPLGVYGVGNLLLRFMSLVLAAVPLLGLLAAVSDLMLGAASYLFVMVFLPSLAIDLAGEAGS